MLRASPLTHAKQGTVCGACAVWSVPPLLKDFARTFVGFGNLGLGWEKSDHYDDIWRCGTGHKRKRTGSQAIARSRASRVELEAPEKGYFVGIARNRNKS